MVLHKQVRDIAFWISLVALVDGQRQQLRQRRVDEAVVVGEDAHAREGVDSHQVLRVVLDAGRGTDGVSMRSTVREERKMRNSPLQELCLRRLLRLVRPDGPERLRE